MPQTSTDTPMRIVSGMRPTGPLHLGHDHGVLRNWRQLQKKADCLFFVADWHALTSHYQTPGALKTDVFEVLLDWLAVGIDPEQATLFLQSWVPEHAELATLLGMITPLSWVERVPTFKEQQAQLKDRDINTYGFLGYPVLQTADIVIHQATHVPVGADQVPHVELTRSIVRRLNNLYGHDMAALNEARERMTPEGRSAFDQAQKHYQSTGDVQAVATGRTLLQQETGLNRKHRNLLQGALEGHGRSLVPLPDTLLAPQSKFLGLDGRKMSKSYHNTIGIREEASSITQKIKVMPTDPARARRSDPGDPEKCPVWAWHTIYASPEQKEWIQQGCRQAGIGCLECKQVLIQAILDEQAPRLERIAPYQAHPERLREVLHEGSQRARSSAASTLKSIKEAMGLVT